LADFFEELEPLPAAMFFLSLVVLLFLAVNGIAIGLSMLGIDKDTAFLIAYSYLAAVFAGITIIRVASYIKHKRREKAINRIN